MLAKGRNAEGSKQWGRKVTCCYQGCTTNTKDSDRRMFPFPKPCSAYVHSLIDSARSEHSVEDCERCAKSYRWIQLCGNAGITNLEDINARTYVCVKHFDDEDGPTPGNPDPVPADDSMPDAKSPRVFRHQRAPSPLVEAIPFVEAVYDCDAVSLRIQQAIQQEQAATSHAHQPYNLQEQLIAARHESTRLSRKLSRCLATSKRRLATIRDLRARLKAAEKGGGATRKT